MQEHINLSDKKAKAMNSKRSLVKKFSEILPPKRVYQLFVLEELLEAGFFGQIAENLPEIK